MIIKVELPKNAKILAINDNEFIVELPPQYVEYQTAVSVLSVNGHTLDDFANNMAIGHQEILITSGGQLETEDYSDNGEEDFFNNEEEDYSETNG